MSNLELCCECDRPTGRAGQGEDSIYTDDGEYGPFCEECWENSANIFTAVIASYRNERVLTKIELKASKAEVERLREALSAIQTTCNSDLGKPFTGLQADALGTLASLVRVDELSAVALAADGEGE